MRHISETVQHQVYAGSVKDAHGNEVETWGAASDLGVYAFNPSSSSEVFIDGHAHRVESTPTLYVPSSSVVGDRDKITARGVTYRVDGVPAVFRNPFDASMNGVSVNLKVVSG